MLRQSSNLQPNEKLPRLLTSKAVSEMLSIPEGTLRYWRKVGIGPKWLKLEGSIRYDLADVLAYIDRGRRTPSVRAGIAKLFSLITVPASIRILPERYLNRCFLLKKTASVWV